MAKARKVHVQLELALRKRDKNGQLRGGKRPGAGRKRKPGRRAEPHGRRAVLKGDEPVHVVLRVLDDVRGLRTRDMFMAVREAAIMTFHNRSCRIVHLSIQEGHLHLLVEADDAAALSRGMQGFEISAAKHINAAATARWGKKRKGKVFADRYHAEIITCPTQAHHTLSYVLNNWRKHREDRAAFTTSWKVDPFSTGASFAGWIERADAVVGWKTRETYNGMPTYLPKTWLLRVGWELGGPISYYDLPGGRR
jgi:REP element-mobilizing transposase RayT